MLDSTWTLIIGLPLIAILIVLVWRRISAVSVRIQEVKEEMARNPQDPYRALADLMASEEATKPRRDRKTNGGGDG